MKKVSHILLSFFTICILLLSSASQLTAEPSDDYIKGYTEAILYKVFDMRSVEVDVRDGLIKIFVPEMSNKNQDKVRSELLDIKGVTTVEIIAHDSAKIEASTPLTRPSTEELDQSDVEIKTSDQKLRALKKERLFDPLIADPRWPHFSIGYQYYIDDRELKNVGFTSFGETLPIYRAQASFGGIWQLGIQAAVFAFFDLDGDSSDLVNADYWVGFPLSYRKERFSALFRLFHQSSHLGDEFLLRERIDRVNLSYESIDAKVSYDWKDWLRVYSGLGYIIRKEPDDLEPWSFQYGVEIKGSQYYMGFLTPIAGADFKAKEEGGWNTDISLRAGLQLESEKTAWHKFHIMLEYFNGISPNGQFYERSIEYISLATHFYFN